MRLIRILKHDLCREVAVWAEEGVISTEQAGKICARYGVDYGNMSRRSYGYQVLVAFGCLFIGLSLMTLIGANWEEIPRAIRMGGLILLTLGANGMGLFTFRQDRKQMAVVWFFLGGLFYGAAIMLIAQIYHIGEHYPDGIFWWAIGVLPAAVLMESSLLMIFSAILAFGWFFVESSLQFYPVLFPLFLAAMAWHLWRVGQSNVLFFLLLFGICLWVEYALAWLLSESPGFDPGPENLALSMGLFVFFHGLSKWLVKRTDSALADYGTLLGIWVLRFAVVALFVFSFDEPWRNFISAHWQMPAVAMACFAVLAVISVALVHGAGSSPVSTIFFSVLVFSGTVAAFLVDDRSHALAFQFADNVVLAAVGVWLIIRGIQDHISQYFFAGVIVLSVTGLLRYLDLVGDYVGASILFAILAAILLLAARYWKKHHQRTGEAT